MAAGSASWGCAGGTCHEGPVPWKPQVLRVPSLVVQPLPHGIHTRAASATAAAEDPQKRPVWSAEVNGGEAGSMGVMVVVSSTENGAGEKESSTLTCTTDPFPALPSSTVHDQVCVMDAPPCPRASTTLAPASSTQLLGDSWGWLPPSSRVLPEPALNELKNGVATVFATAIPVRPCCPTVTVTEPS